MDTEHDVVVRRRDATMRRWGMRSWYFVGAAVATGIVFAGLSAVSGLVVPLLVATVMAVLFVPSTDVLSRFVPRSVAAALVLVGLVAVMIGAVAVAIDSVIDQAPEIREQLAEGIERVGDWLDEEGWTSNDSESVVDDLDAMWTAAVPGATGYLSTVFSSVTAFAVGSLVAVFMLYFGLKDWVALSDWVAGHIGVDEEVGRDIVADSNWSMRQYFMALTISSLVVAVIVGATVAILGLPLAFTIAVVTFTTSYVPYLGAIVSGAFATLIALGSGGPADAMIILVVVLVTQNVVQTIVQTKLTEGRLKLHPIVIFGSTIAGGAVFGVLGAALSTPVVAIILQVHRRTNPELSHHQASRDGEPR